MRAVLLILSVAALRAESDPGGVLARVREKLQDTIGKMPRYTCTQNISRVQYEPRQALRARSCEAARRLGARSLTKTTSDRLRLDVGVTGKTEIYSWAGENRFGDRGLIDLVGGGPISSGTFASFVIMIFGTKAADISFAREVTEKGRRLLEYEYKVPLDRSQYVFGSQGMHGLVAYGGTFWLDPAGDDLVRLIVAVESPPDYSHACSAASTLEFSRVRLRDSDFLLPHDTMLRIVNDDGIVTENRTAYSACHEFAGESSIKFGEEDDAAAPPPPGRAERAAGPVKLAQQISFEVRIAQDIDIEKAAGGDSIRTELVTPITDERGAVLVRAPALVLGRILRVQSYFGPRPYVNLKWRVESIEIGGRQQPLAARTLGLEEDKALLMRLNVGSRRVLKSGSVSKWVTE